MKNGFLNQVSPAKNVKSVRPILGALNLVQVRLLGKSVASIPSIHIPGAKEHYLKICGY